MNSVVIYTDGACKGNPGPGGWGVLLRSEAAVKELYGGEAQTTNNRMELTAVIQALQALKRPCRVTLWLDSEYVRKGITEWLPGWKAKGWKTAARQPVKNVDLWQQLDALVQQGGHASTGAGSGAMPATPATSAPTPWPTWAWRRRARPARSPTDC